MLLLTRTMRPRSAILLVLCLGLAPCSKALPEALQLRKNDGNTYTAHQGSATAMAELQGLRQSTAQGQHALLVSERPATHAKPTQATTQQQKGSSILTSLSSTARRLLGNWAGTDAPAFNAAAMGYYQGYPNLFRKDNAEASLWAAQNGDPTNFGAGFNPYMAPQGVGRKLRSQQGNWVGTDVPAFNAAAMGYYQGYPNRFRQGNAQSSMWAAQAGDPNNFGAGYNPYMAPQTGYQARKLRSQQGNWVGTDVPAFNAAAMGYYQGYPNRFRQGNAQSSMWAAQAGDPNNFGAGYNPYMAPQMGYRARKMMNAY